MLGKQTGYENGVEQQLLGVQLIFSVVIPTHNRLDLLRDAIETVLRQDYSDWELVIFDNASTDPIDAYVKGLSDRRIRYERSSEFLPVTDSWNRAIDLASGDYVTLLGDDDGLTPDYFSKLGRVIEEFDSPDVLYSAIYQFLHPGVAPWAREGYLANLQNGFFFVGRRSPFVLEKKEALKAVEGSLGLRRNFTFNMQAFCFQRDFLKRLREDGPVFRSPFPDYYLANIAFAKARTLVVIPEPMAIAGVSKASYGYTLFNGLENKGIELLNTKLTSDPLYPAVEKFLLPGPSYITNYVVTMEHVSRYVQDFTRSAVAFGRYRRLQIFRVLMSNGGFRSLGNVAWSRLTLAEQAWTIALFLLIRSSQVLRVYGKSISPALEHFLGMYDYFPPNDIVNRGRYSRLIQQFVALDYKQPAPMIQPDSLSNQEERAPGWASATADSSRKRKPDSVAVVYLARMAEGLAPLRAFAESYVRNPAGIAHELVVVYKGFEKADDLQMAKSVFAALPHVSLEISDEGVDINAYRKAAGELNHDYLCFLNTFTTIASPDWLAMLYKHASMPGVGIAGATGSYESLYDSFALVNKVIWLCSEIRIKYDAQLALYYDFILDAYCKPWKMATSKPRICAAIRTLLYSARYSLSRLRRRDYRAAFAWISRNPDSSDKNFRRIWERLVSSGGIFYDYSKFPKFPNPHIRSNAFMMSRHGFLSLQGGNSTNKLDACAFESGFDSMTNQLRRRGLRPVIVDSYGKSYDIADWFRSKTFRLGNQDDLIVRDNQCRVFDNMTPGARATHVRMTWGDYIGVAPPNRPDLDFKFAVDPLMSIKSYKFSFLIPSKNRLQLLKRAVDSILRQGYSNIEIVISDNASDDDYASFVNEIDDNRIVYRRLSEPVSATENWKRALELATGDYVLMLGDDDALAPGSIKRMAEVVLAERNPDIVYMAAYHYCYPNVIPSTPHGYLADVRNSIFFKDRVGSFRLPLEQARSVARAVGDFRYKFGFNSQHFLFRVGFLQNFSAMGGVFQSPYPDTFAATVSFMKANSIVVVPEPMIIIGISPKSFGYYYFNDKQTAGYEFLDNEQVSKEIRDTLRDVLLSGDGNNSNWLVAIEAARRALAPDVALTINIGRYRVLQMVAFLRDSYIRNIYQRREIKHFMSQLTMSERALFLVLLVAIGAADRMGQKYKFRLFGYITFQLKQFWPASVTMIDIGKHTNISDAFNWLASKQVKDDVVTEALV